MYFTKTFLKRNITYISIIIFFMALYIIHINKPILVYDNNGSIRHFGIGTMQKTIIPLWLICILLPIFIYTILLNYIYFIR